MATLHLHLASLFPSSPLQERHLARGGAEQTQARVSHCRQPGRGERVRRDLIYLEESSRGGGLEGEWTRTGSLLAEEASEYQQLLLLFPSLQQPARLARVREGKGRARSRQIKPNIQTSSSLCVAAAATRRPRRPPWEKWRQEKVARFSALLLPTGLSGWRWNGKWISGPLFRLEFPFPKMFPS